MLQVLDVLEVLEAAHLEHLEDLEHLEHMSSDAIIVLTTLASTNEAVALVRELLERRLIACANILPGVRSIYRWEGKVADEQEVIVLLKTRTVRLDALEMAFGEMHPYKVPELLALPVSAGLHKYLEWIGDETSLMLS